MFFLPDEQEKENNEIKHKKVYHIHLIFNFFLNKINYSTE